MSHKSLFGMTLDFADKISKASRRDRQAAIAEAFKQNKIYFASGANGGIDLFAYNWDYDADITMRKPFAKALKEHVIDGDFSMAEWQEMKKSMLACIAEIDKKMKRREAKK